MESMMSSSRSISPRLAVLIVGLVLVLLGVIVWLYAGFSVSNLENALTKPGLAQEDYWRLEGSLKWWIDASLNLYYPLAAILIAVGASVFLFLLLVWRR